jgi:hypothetical protein
MTDALRIIAWVAGIGAVVFAVQAAIAHNWLGLIVNSALAVVLPTNMELIRRQRLRARRRPESEIGATRRQGDWRMQARVAVAFEVRVCRA